MYMLWTSLAIVAFAATQGCVSNGEKGAREQPALAPNAAVVRVFFATDRNLTASSSPLEKFGANRAEVKYGTCDVSIPRDHRMGELEGPSLLRLQFSPDPVRHVVLLSATLSSRDRFFEELRTKANSQGSSALLFVHGYNVTFADAARRTAQMAYDLGFGGAPIFYSWPSVGETAAYTVDEQNIEWSEANFTMFLRDFLNRSQAQRIYLIGHSMGNRALARAVAAVLAERPDLSKRLRAIILAAPDIDAQVFKRDIAPALVATHVPITMYASADDRALTASKFLAGGYARAGDINDGVVIVTGIETVDATSSDTGLVGHSYFAEQRSMLADIFDTIRNGLAADQRFGLLPVDTSLGRYWKVKR